MMKLDCTFKMFYERTIYKLSVKGGDDYGLVTWYDCGWPYEVKYSVNEIDKRIEIGDWILMENLDG